MAVKIRLRRMGAKKSPFYRIVVADSRFPRDGRFIEQLGYYDPNKDPSIIEMDLEKAEKWMKNGAQPTDIVKKLMLHAKNKKIAGPAPQESVPEEPEAKLELPAEDVPAPEPSVEPAEGSSTPEKIEEPAEGSSTPETAEEQAEDSSTPETNEEPEVPAAQESLE